MTPKIGDYILTDRLGEAEIIRVRDFGTYDVRCRATDKYYRITGLMGADWRAVGRYQPEPGSNFEPTLYASAE
jgi:hypothetical protein